ncbi:MAG: ribonuclease R [Rikenellaceae bacterium]
MRKKRISNFDRKEFILNLLRENSGTKYSLKHLASAVGANDKSTRRDVLDILLEMERDGLVKEVARSKFQLTTKERTHYTGKVDMTQSGIIFVKCPDLESDVHIGSYSTLNALHQDRVEFVIKRAAKGNRSAEGEITAIVERSSKLYLGIADVRETSVFIRPTSRNLPYDVYISKRTCPDLEDGKKVSFRIVEWEVGTKSPKGEIVDVLGDVGDNDTEMHAILAEYDLPYHFDPAIEDAAAAIDGKITEQDYAERRDMRGVVTFTVDPADAKDFDDALSVERMEDGVWEIGVHIADVTHYVRPGSAIEAEAQERATSVYLVDRTVPMLPERLSNELCSLRPHEEKLCFSAVFKINENLEILEEWFGRTVIYSDRRFTYAEAQDVIETGEGDYKEEVLTLNRLAQKMRAKRFKDGAIGFEREEMKFDLDEKGHPIGVYAKEAKEANKMIEEFMLLANRRVAEYCAFRRSATRKTPRTMVYRVHDKPDEEKLDSFRSFILRFGHYFKATSGVAVAHEINDLLARIKGSTEENVVSMLAIRSMAKAVYTTENIGHYGLAFPFYTHFTSPIRRYPDMMVHRLLAHYLGGGRSLSKEPIEEQAQHSSDRELVAANAERASIKYKAVEFMRDRMDEEFDGHISGMKEWGLFVEVDDTHIEGMIPVRELGDDYYTFDENSYEFIGRSTRQTFTLGDAVRVKIKSADLGKRMLDFSLVCKIGEDGQEAEAIDWESKPSTQKRKPTDKKRAKKGEKGGKGRKRR